MASGHRWNMVGDEFVKLFTTEYVNDGALHWPTVIGAAACLCGETALVASESRLPEHGALDSPRVAEFMNNGKVPNRTILGYSAMVANQAFGVDAESLPTYKTVIAQLGPQLLPGSFPALNVSAHLVPHETPMNAGPRLRKTVHRISEQQGLSTHDSAFALATATMKMIGSAQMLGARDLTILAFQCCIAGSRFALALDTISNPAIQRSKVDKMETILDEAMRAEEATYRMPAAAAVAAALGSG